MYRKYRSKTLNEIIGQEHITDVLAPAIKNGVFSHAYLFTGPRGIGKTSVARIIAYMVNDLKYGETSFDIIEIDAASHGLKEDIKDLIEKARIAPTKEKYKVYIIDEVHSMKHDAFNTFLKLLEEPPEHVIFILATTDPQKLPATILSRAQRFHFRPVEQEKVIKHLKNIAKKEQIDIDDDALTMIAERGEGSMRDSISLLDQLSGYGKKITAKSVEELLGLIPEKQIKKITDSIGKHDIESINSVLTELKSQGISPNTVVSQLNKELLKTNHYELVYELLDATKSLDPWLKILAILGRYCSESIDALVVKTIEPEKEVKKPEAKKEVACEVKTEVISNKQDEIVEKVEKMPEEVEVKEEEKVETSSPLEIDWQKIVTESKKLSGLCGAWIAQASHEYDGEVITLYFRTKLQRETMKEAKCWSTLKKTLKNLYENPPTVIVSDGPKPKSEKVSKVADIMGGGELL